RAGLGALSGAVAGAAFWMPQISWLTLYLGPIPWLALCGVMIAWFALFGLAAALATRGLARLRLSPQAVVAVQSFAVAGLWVLREQLQSTWPYGGFAWGRLAHTQAEGPLAPLVSWVGFSGLSGLLALAGAVLGAVLVAAWFGTGIAAVPDAADAQDVQGSKLRSRRLRLLAVVVGASLALGMLALVPPAHVERAGTLRVAAVQGNAKSAIFDDRENGDVFRDHVEATATLLDRLEAEGETVDAIVWPENSAEFALPDQPYRELALRELSERADAPIVVGTVLRDPDDTFTNSTLVYDEAGGTGVRYDKRRPVPFAEYMPNREFFRALVPDLVDLVRLDYRAGTRSAVLEIDGAGGSFAAGIAICFDIIFDDHAVALMGRGPTGGGVESQVIFAQTNNADFGRTDESAQQLAIARLRAVETGRALVNISTVGTSAIVLPDGADVDRLTPFTRDAMVAEVPLSTGETPALRYGPVVAAAWMLLGAAGVIAGVIVGAIRGPIDGSVFRRRNAAQRETD
ncbi:apolipoprotein N-acyltransferase, partial [Leucobacter soli]